jgi:phosphonate transport system ATP-binding protein
VLASNFSLPAIACQEATTAVVPALRRPILNRVSFSVQAGEFVALLGLNGAGKSSLLRAMIGLMPLQQGNISIYGTAIAPANLPRIRQQVSVLFQGGALIPQLSALDNVLCGCLGRHAPWQTLFGFDKTERRRALDLLTRLGLRDLAYQQTARLSGGQQQRVAIARALMATPRILLVDEPITGLDVLATRQVMDILTELNQQGMTIVAILHDLALAETYAQRAIVLDAGQVIHDGDCDHLPIRLTQSMLNATVA